MRRDPLPRIDECIPPMGWTHATSTGELIASAPPLPSRPERRRTQRAAQPESSDCIRITGELMQDACVRYQAAPADGSTPRRAWLQVRLMIPGGLFVMAAQELGSTSAAHVAGEGRTRYLRRGLTCTVQGKGSMVVQQQGENVLQVLFPTIFVEPMPARHEPSSGASS